MGSKHESLGWALAHLQAEGKGPAPSAADADNVLLAKMKERYRQLSSNGQLKAVLESLPEQSCLSEKPFLESNEDFFIVLFSDIKHEEACIKLYTHMNDCFSCFEIFSQVLRDYYRFGENHYTAHAGGGGQDD